MAAAYANRDREWHSAAEPRNWGEYAGLCQRNVLNDCLPGSRYPPPIEQRPASVYGCSANVSLAFSAEGTDISPHLHL